MRINRFSRYDLKRETVIQRARFASWKKKRREKKGKDRSEAQIDNVRVKWTRETGYAFVKPRRATHFSSIKNRIEWATCTIGSRSNFVDIEFIRAIVNDLRSIRESVVRSKLVAKM